MYELLMLVAGVFLFLGLYRLRTVSEEDAGDRGWLLIPVSRRAVRASAPLLIASAAVLAAALLTGAA